MPENNEQGLDNSMAFIISDEIKETVRIVDKMILQLVHTPFLKIIRDINDQQITESVNGILEKSKFLNATCMKADVETVELGDPKVILDEIHESTLRKLHMPYLVDDDEVDERLVVPRSEIDYKGMIEKILAKESLEDTDKKMYSYIMGGVNTDTLDQFNAVTDLRKLLKSVLLMTPVAKRSPVIKGARFNKKE